MGIFVYNFAQAAVNVLFFLFCFKRGPSELVRPACGTDNFLTRSRYHLELGECLRITRKIFSSGVPPIT